VRSGGNDNRNDANPGARSAWGRSGQGCSEKNAQPRSGMAIIRQGGKEEDMAFEDKEAELGLLLTRMQNEPEDLHEIYLEIRFKLNELKAFGVPLPADLVQFERDLEAEFAAEKEDAERWTRMDGVVAQRAKR
jgi:hypothetical protein